MTSFQELGLSGSTLDALTSKGFTAPTPIQALTIPRLLSGTRDIVGQAQTGTGKTAAFGLPVIEAAEEGARRVQSLILAPTRELAIQVAEEIDSLKGGKRIRVLPVYGGQAIHMQLKALRQGVDVVVGTPGRIMDHLERGSLRIDQLTYFILDEADEMCNMGFVDDVRAILASANADRRTLMFSATMGGEVMAIAREFMGDFDVVRVKPEVSDAPLTRQVFHEIADSDRFEALCRVIDARPDFYGLVFVRTRADADLVAARLTQRGYPAEPIHGDLNQAQREKILSGFRERKATILVATDVAARGIDVPDLTHVVNFALPQDPQTFVHRTGRTGRAGKQGVAITLITPNEFRKLMYIAKSTGIDIAKEPLPRIEDVIHSKKRKVVDELNAILEAEGHGAYLAMAGELLHDRPAEEVVAALLRSAFGEELVESGYRRIEPVGPAGRGRADMTCALGRAHGMNPKRFVDFIASAANVKQWAIQHVRVQNDRTTFTVPAAEADRVMERVNSREGETLVTRDESRRKPPGRKFPQKGWKPAGKAPRTQRRKPQPGR
ncbi:DEAD/DEAH box helicase domain protein [Pseudodesulfovibrio mercurii]|uniref:RNA helicase n=1 Tax=Pseudodesulfovibrio mercurii TaxID=641491 RepID=F0JKD6_9BACT|nr:DEAD/DEAH box helicase [Pseudodesulfovibrio mercurii]EGB16385.1 DEAD/DEAH box helicase domain protein [Pseudodesulfovibrio mercurii]